MSNTPVETSLETKLSVASHLSNLPSIRTEALTLNVISLSVGVNRENRDFLRRLRRRCG